jgi:hypothetical protein
MATSKVRLIRFRFRAAVLVGDLVFLEQIRHFLGHHGIIILNSDEGDFFSHLRLFFRRRLVWLFLTIAHSFSIHQQGVLWLTYSNASSDDFSGNCRLQPLQVTK